MVRRRELFADHADGLIARVEVDVAFTPLFVSKVPCTKIVIARITGCPVPE